MEVVPVLCVEVLPLSNSASSKISSLLRIECRLIIIDLEDHDDYNEHDDPEAQKTLHYGRHRDVPI